MGFHQAPIKLREGFRFESGDIFVRQEKLVRAAPSPLLSVCTGPGLSAAL
jgi:hypothetical protein